MSAPKTVTHVARHTPGPWAARSFAAYGYGITAADSPQARDSFAVVHFADSTRGRTTERAKADARLIAAAPDLLALALRLEPWLTGHEQAERDRGWREHDSQFLMDLRDAIAKATGSTA